MALIWLHIRTMVWHEIGNIYNSKNMFENMCKLLPNESYRLIRQATSNYFKNKKEKEIWLIYVRHICILFAKHKNTSDHYLSNIKYAVNYPSTTKYTHTYTYVWHRKLRNHRISTYAINMLGLNVGSLWLLIFIHSTLVLSRQVHGWSS